MTNRPPISDEDEALLSLLASRKPSELTPVMLELSRRHAARRRPAELLSQFDHDPFVFPSKVDLRSSLAFDHAAMMAADQFEAILLSPLAPLGSCSVVSPTTQDRSVVTTRNNEVVSDPTNVLAIECARRLMRTREDVRLTTVHQVVRPQRFPAQYGWSQHFRLFALAEAGCSQAEYEFEVGAIARHAAVFFRLFDIAQESLGAVISDRRLILHVAVHNGPLGDRLEKRLRTKFPSVAIDRKDPFASNYYCPSSGILRQKAA
jgi:hypothetical protein